MCHADSARRRRWRRLTLDGGLVFPAVFVHRRYLEEDGRTVSEQRWRRAHDV